MKVFVTAGTGVVGTALTAELRSREAEVSVLTRDADKAAALPAGVRGVVGDLLDFELVRTEFAAADAVFLNLPVGAEELYQGILAVDAAKRAEVKHLVYLSAQDVETMVTAPYCAGKATIEQALKDSGVPYTIIRRGELMQNDIGAKQMLDMGIYGIPFGEIGVSRVDVRDVAEAAAIVLTTPGHLGETYTVTGPEPVTGRFVAETWKRVLDSEVAYVGDDLDSCWQILNQMMPSHIARDIWLMYEHYDHHGHVAAEDDVVRATKLLGHPPRSFTEFAEETAAAWKS
ncbi:SDR family oxidoreductase [Actinomadura chibensis]|uniref:NAD(P)H-binding protein n=1 Tax=Actinomadura chibensis TaxID=392828 RepID=A0A5D0NLF0_9ACTN|nr:NAD(P)H-binding protein [Actinomadura chibensis]TYB44911.1 NAD(P)H-binding protein [Actinomadura chibensis]